MNKTKKKQKQEKSNATQFNPSQNTLNYEGKKYTSLTLKVRNYSIQTETFFTHGRQYERRSLRMN